MCQECGAGEGRDRQWRWSISGGVSVGLVSDCAWRSSPCECIARWLEDYRHFDHSHPSWFLLRKCLYIKIWAVDYRQRVLKLQWEFPCRPNPGSSSYRMLTAGVSAVFLPEGGEPIDLRNLCASTSRLVAIRPIWGSRVSSAGKYRNYLPIVVEPMSATTNRI